MVEHEVFDNRFTGKLVAEAVLRVFEADGTIYLATGYLTWSGYLTIRDSLQEFLARSTNNRVVIVVSTGPISSLAWSRLRSEASMSTRGCNC